jgi:hypothetical protein
MKNFSIFKNQPNTNEKAPTHTISANVGTKEQPEYVTIGSCWTKEAKNGKFLSCQLQDEYVDHNDKTKTRKGYKIVDEVAVRDNETGEVIPDSVMDDIGF